MVDGGEREDEGSPGDREIRRLLDSGARKQAHEALMEEHGAALRRYVRGHAPRGAEVADLEDAAWEGTFQALPRFPRDVPLVALVIGVARHVVADAFGASAHDELPSHLSEVRQLFPGRDSAPATPSAELGRQERIERVRRALMGLRAPDRELLDLRWVQELKPKAIAQVLGGGVKANTISQRLVEAGRRFAALLESEPSA